MKIQWGTLIVFLALVYAVAFLGSLFTDTGKWYESVRTSTTPQTGFSQLCGIFYFS